MGSQIIKQTLIDGKPLLVDGHECEPGKYAVWCSIVDNFTLFNATREEVIEDYVERERERIERSIGRKLDKVEAGEPAYYQFTRTFEESVQQAIDFHGETAFALEDPEKDRCPECHHESGENHEAGCPGIGAVYCPCCFKYPKLEPHVKNCEYGERLQHQSKMRELDARQTAIDSLDGKCIGGNDRCRGCGVPEKRISEYETRNYGHQETCPQRRWTKT